MLSDRNKLERYLIDAGYADIIGISSPTTPTPTPTINDKFVFGEEIDIANRPKIALPTELDLPETKRLVVELKKDSNGLGITIAGYVCEKEELSGIFVKSVSAGSAADLSGKIQVNDRIIEVDNQSLQGFSNHQAVEVLKMSGTVVSLRLERYLRGPKYEQLQQAIAANEMKPTTPGCSGTIFASIRSQSSSTQNIGNVDLARHPSHSGSSYTEAATVKLTDSLLSAAAKETIEPLSNQSRKLMNARDSIENKISKDIISIETSTDDTIHENDQSTPEIKSTVAGTTEKSKYWVESVLTKNMENTIINKWQTVLGISSNITVAQIRKFSATSGLGISLEGTVDVEGGREVRPHHYIRSILPEGPVGQNGLLRSGDELLGKHLTIYYYYIIMAVIIQ